MNAAVKPSESEYAEGRGLAERVRQMLPKSDTGCAAACMYIILLMAYDLQDIGGQEATADFLERESANFRAGKYRQMVH
jgi:hypothetical protein